MTKTKKIEIYESILHQIQLLREVSCNSQKLYVLLDDIGNWSYGHRVGNGTLTYRQQNKLIKNSLLKMYDSTFPPLPPRK